MPIITQKVKVGAGEILDRLMQTKHISIVDLSRRSGISRTHLDRMRKDESDIHNMRLSTINAIANVLDVPPKLFINAPYTVVREQEFILLIKNKEEKE